MESLVVFAKTPIAGQVKTRLARERSERDALVLYAGFMRDLADSMRSWREQRVAADQNRRLVLAVTPHSEDPMIAEIAGLSGARIVVQPEGDLGTRMRTVIDDEFRRGARAVCVIGTDSPTLPAHLLDHAFRALLFERVVLGPTFDGGYWLVGAQRPAPDIFTGIPWSTSSVLMKTLALLRRQGVNAHLLPFWYDIDTAMDLERLVWHVKAMRAAEPNSVPATWKALSQIGLVREARPVR